MALPIELDQELETVGPVDFGGIDTAFTAHGKIDSGTGELHAFGYQFANPHLTYYRIDHAGQVVERRAIDVGAPCLMHDFAMTERYAIFFDTPTVMVKGGEAAACRSAGRKGEAHASASCPARAAPGRGSDVPACQLTHTANAFEQDGHIIVDGIRTNRFLADMAADPPVLYRWEIDLTRGVVTEAAIGLHPVELPRIDERRNGRPYRHAYTVEYREAGPGGLPGSSLLCRYDVETGKSVAKDFGERYVPGEPSSSRSPRRPARMTGGCSAAL